jgi:hypothetical protein
MDAPIGVSRFFRTMATVGPSLSLALIFGWRYLLTQLHRIGIGHDDDPVAAIVEKQTAMGVRMFDLDQTLQQCLARLPKNDPREQQDPEEGRSFLAIAKLIAAGIMSRHYAAAAVWPDVAKLPAEVALRSQHAKAHGCVHAQFIVNDKLSPEVAGGAFVPGKHYDAVLRFSNSHDSIQPDKKGDGRGLAIKLALPEGPNKQDFVLVNSPVFFVDDLAEYGRFLEIIHDRSSSLMTTLRLIGFFLPWRLRKGLIFLRLFLSTIKDPFDATYHSMSPYALGDLVVRYIVAPAQRTGDDGDDRGGDGGASEEQTNYLRDRLQQRLSRGMDVVLDFSVQIRDRATVEDVEQPSRAWQRAADRVVPIASIVVPPQEFTTADKFCNCEDMRFSPWHCLSQHRPLGGLNRARLFAYLVSSQVRRRLNMVDTR